MTSTHRSYFDDMYASDPDPWRFETSAYERRKYALTMASLPKPHYRSAFEPGCSVGVLTEMLATRCDRLLATDMVPSALERARGRLAARSHVTLAAQAIPEEWPAGPFDLIMLSEIAYYFSEADLGRVLTRVVRSTPPGAHVVGVHWRGETDYPLSGDRTHGLIDGWAHLENLVHHVETDFVLDVWERQP
jgi:cyclopropane fatty-acyl-phospholipid synthase-like methyltransferase